MGLPLVLLHAFPLSAAMWASQLELAELVVAPDQRGFGGSPLGSDEPSLDRLADDIAELIDARGLDRVVLGGLSMGGYVAMAFARRHPQRLAGLILADTKMTADPPTGVANRHRIADLLEADPASPVLLEELYPKLVGETTKRTRPDVVARVTSWVQSAPAPAAVWAQRAMAARPDSSETLRQVAVPALVLVGDEDEQSPPADAEAMASVLPDSRLVVIPSAGHLSAVEAPQAFNAAVQHFLTELQH